MIKSTIIGFCLGIAFMLLGCVFGMFGVEFIAGCLLAAGLLSWVIAVLAIMLEVISEL